MPIGVRTFMSKNEMPMSSTQAKVLSFWGSAPPQTPVFGGRGRLCHLTPTRSSVPGLSWGLNPQTPSVPLFSLLEVATLVLAK